MMDSMVDFMSSKFLSAVTAVALTTKAMSSLGNLVVPEINKKIINAKRDRI